MLRILWAVALCILAGMSGLGLAVALGFSSEPFGGGIAGFFGMAAFLLWRAWPLIR